MSLSESFMKKILISAILAALILSTANAQFTKIGGGIAYGTGYWFQKTKVDEYRSPHFAGFIEGVYRITTPIHVAASVSYFYPHREKYAQSRTAVSELMFDINGHYVINSLDKFEFYALAGLDFLLTWKKDRVLETDQVFSFNDNALGLNLGGGACFNMTKKISLFTEVKYVVSKYGQFMANAGVFINVDWLSKHEDDKL